MYVPEHFRAPGQEAVMSLLRSAGMVDLVTSTQSGLLATPLPMLYDGSARQHGSLVGHVARNNPHCRRPAIGDALVIVHGPDSYITPTWYATTREHGRVVPTWDYVVAHVYGRLIVHDDVDWLAAHVRRLTEHHEADLHPQWTVDSAPAPFVAGQLHAIVGVEVAIDRIEAKYKLSQNRSRADVEGVVAGLAAGGDAGTAEAVRRASAG